MHDRAVEKLSSLRVAKRARVVNNDWLLKTTWSKRARQPANWFQNLSERVSPFNYTYLTWPVHSSSYGHWWMRRWCHTMELVLMPRLRRLGNCMSEYDKLTVQYCTTVVRQLYAKCRWRCFIRKSCITHVLADVYCTHTCDHGLTLWRPLLPHGYSYNA